MKLFFILLVILWLGLFADNSSAVKLEIKGVIGPASSSYLKDGIAFAKAKNAHIILIELDTPGGLSTSMKEMIQEITNSSIPVITYVYPKGAQAASAGTYILYASHIAAMSPGTNLGAATPVSLMPATADLNSSAMSTLEKKATYDAMAYIKSLAELNDRNVSWGISAVEESKSISAQDALKYGVIDIIAQNTQELFNQLDNRSVVVSGKSITLDTKNIVMHSFEADWKTRFLSVITNPNIAYMLLLIAIYGIFFELMNPGTMVSGIIGVIAGVIALYALNMLPFNYAGLLLILLGIAFMVAEVFVTGFGILGIGGVVAFVFGSLLLFDADTLGSGISIPLIVAFSISSFAFFIFVMRLFLSSRSAKIVSGAEEMLGSEAEVIESFENGYFVHCHGETWSAISESKLSVGDIVEVTGLSGLILKVKSIKE